MAEWVTLQSRELSVNLARHSEKGNKGDEAPVLEKQHPGNPLLGGSMLSSPLGQDAPSIQAYPKLLRASREGQGTMHVSRKHTRKKKTKMYTEQAITAGQLLS